MFPAQRPSLFEMGAWQAALEDWAWPLPADLLVLNEAISRVTRFEVFRAGVCLWEAEPGLFERERDRAFLLHADSAWFRQQEREALHDALH